MPDEAAARPGSTIDLSRRMDRLELSHEALAREVTGLGATVSAIALTQKHQDEIATERHDNLKEKLVGLTGKLDGFMDRIEGMIDGTIQTAQTRQGAELVLDYQKWRKEVDADRTKLALIGRLGVLLVSSNVLAWTVTVIVFVANRP